MARKAKTKTQKVEEYIAANPEKSAGEVAQAVKVTPGLVYNVRSKMKGETSVPNRKRGRSGETVRRAVRQTDATNGKTNEYSHVIEAARFIQSCGGIEKAQSALDAAGEVALAMKA